MTAKSGECAVSMVWEVKKNEGKVDFVWHWFLRRFVLIAPFNLPF